MHTHIFVPAAAPITRHISVPNPRCSSTIPLFHSDTLAELHAWKAENTYSWCKDLRSAKQHMEERKQKHARIDLEDKYCYKELCRRIDLMLSDPSREILLEGRYEKSLPSRKKKQKEAEPPKKVLTDWWMNAGITLKPLIPASCTAAEGNNQKRGKVSFKLMHYLLSHALLDDVRRFLSDVMFFAFAAAKLARHALKCIVFRPRCCESNPSCFKMLCFATLSLQIKPGMYQNVSLCTTFVEILPLGMKMLCFITLFCN